jgi:hypothetical protein
MSIKILFKSSIAKILIIVLFLKIMLIMDFQKYCLIYVHICYYSKYWNEILLKKLSFMKKHYNVFHCPKKCIPSPFSLALCHTLYFSQWNNEKLSFE